MKEETKYKWALSPSKFAGAAGCPVFEEDQDYGAVYKDRGTDLHALAENEDAPLDGLSPKEVEAVTFCREAIKELRALAGPFPAEGKEVSIDATDRHPRGKLDYMAVAYDGTVFVRDHKMGTQEVSAEDNPQLQAYAVMAYDKARLHYGGLIKLVNVGIIQPEFEATPFVEYTPEDLDRIVEELKIANERVTDPFRQPEPSEKCRRCKHAAKCPAVTGAVTRFVEQTQLLPMPEAFAPDAIVSIKDRVIAQQLAGILEAWAGQIKKSNREFAIQNGGTLGGVYSISTRSNGFEISDIATFAEGLLEAELIENKADILHFVKLAKGKLIEGLTQVDGDAGKVKAIVAELEERLGVPRPPVTVFRLGGKKQIAEAVALLDVPMIKSPWGKE
jgi:hypothetical protein